MPATLSLSSHARLKKLEDAEDSSKAGFVFGYLLLQLPVRPVRSCSLESVDQPSASTATSRNMSLRFVVTRSMSGHPGTKTHHPNSQAQQGLGHGL